MSTFISSTPTTEKDDLKLARELLKKDKVEDIDIYLPGLEHKQHFFTNTGRASLYIILKALNISKEDEIILQSFTCMAVVVPPLWLKIKPIYADIDPDTYNMTLESLKRRVSNKTRAVIVQHTFGVPTPIEEIKEYIDQLNKERAIENKIYLIEDCAHCLNIKKGEKYLGTFGDVSFFSFGQDKVVSTTQGGCIVSNDKEIEKKIGETYKNIPDMPERIIKYNLRYPLLWNIIKKMYYIPQFTANSNRLSKFTIGKFLILIFRFLGLTKSQASIKDFGNPIEDVYKLSIKQKYLLRNQLEKIDKLTKHRKDIVAKYSKLLNLDLKGSLIRYPVLVDSPSAVKAKLQKIRVIAGNWYNYPVIPRGIDLKKVQYHLGTCPNTEYIMEHIVNLPTSVEVSSEDVDNIVNIVKAHLL